MGLFGRAVGCALVCAAVAGCVGGGRVLPHEDADMRALYARAYGGEQGPPSSGAMDVRMARFCERLADGAVFGSADRRLRACLQTAEAEGLLSGVLAERDCDGPGCGGRIAVEARVPPPLNPAWSGTAAAGIERVFPRLANPDVLVYVYPHVATQLGVGVPGYLTAMPLFGRVEYALPGEVVSTVPPAEWPAWEPQGVVQATGSARAGEGVGGGPEEGPGGAVEAGETEPAGRAPGVTEE